MGWSTGLWHCSNVGQMHRLFLIVVLLELTSCVAPVGPAPQKDSASQEANSDPAADTEVAVASPGFSEEGSQDPSLPKPPYLLNTNNIIKLVFRKSPRVTAAREEMLAAQYGLDEFRFNLSRFEPFVEASSDLADFPHRIGAFGAAAEAVAGIEKETFEGALVRLEAGGGYSHFDFSDVGPGQDRREEGGGVLVRGRLEKPFFGSRRRQNRVIAQAFQESNARKGQLDYLDSYREYVDDALLYYIRVNYYQQQRNVYQRYADDLAALMASPDVKKEDSGRVESLKSKAERDRDEYEQEYREYLTYLLATIDIGPGEEYEIEPAEPYKLSPLAMDNGDSEKIESLIQRARENNPTFTVLRDAIENAQLQRQQAIDGSYDVTTFLEGTLFPVGSESFDDRLNGWVFGGGVTVRLNDHRVLNSTRLKAEAEIRQFRARLKAEETTMRRRITIEARGLYENDRVRTKLLEALQQGKRVYEERRRAYFAGQINIDQLLDARLSVASTESNLESNLYMVRNRVRRLAGTLGRIYDVVGLEFGDRADGS